MVAGCEYIYTKQPPTELSCNPYETDRLALTCTVEGPNTQRFFIAWFRKSNDRADQEELQESQPRVKVDVSSPDPGSVARHSSRLAIMPLDEMKDVGDYWCQVRLDNGTLFQAKSNILTLNATEKYTRLSRCMMSQFVEEESCIETLQVTESAVTADGNIPTNAESIFQTTSSSDPSPVTGGSSERNSSNSDNLAALYAVVGIIVVFCVVIVTLSIIIVVLYRKKCGPVRFKTGGEMFMVYYMEHTH